MRKYKEERQIEIKLEQEEKARKRKEERARIEALRKEEQKWLVKYHVKSEMEAKSQEEKDKFLEEVFLRITEELEGPSPKVQEFLSRTLAKKREAAQKAVKDYEEDAYDFHDDPFREVGEKFSEFSEHVGMDLAQLYALFSFI